MNFLRRLKAQAVRPAPGPRPSVLFALGGAAPPASARGWRKRRRRGRPAYERLRAAGPLGELDYYGTITVPAPRRLRVAR